MRMTLLAFARCSMAMKLSNGWKSSMKTFESCGTRSRHAARPPEAAPSATSISL
jgi:hypothetical protein